MRKRFRRLDRPALGLAAAALLTLACVPRPAILAPADQSDAGDAAPVPVEIELGALGPQATYRVTLLSRIDSPPARITDVTGAFTLNGTRATGELGLGALSNGRNSLFVSIDGDGDGTSDNVVSSTFSWSSLMAGACAKVITPVVGVNHTDPIYMAGFGNDRQACTDGEVAPEDENCQFGPAHDDLWARGFVLESGDQKIAVVTLDVVGYFYNEVQTIRSLIEPGYGFDAVHVTSTHNHEGPDTMGLWGANQTVTGVDLGYLDFVNDTVVECIEEANANLAPAELRFATGDTVGTSLPPWEDLVADGRVLQAMTIPAAVLTNRDEDLVLDGDPGPILNTTVPTLQARRRHDQQIIVTAVNYASHPEVLADDSRTMTSDFPHYMREALEARYGGTAIYISGDLGVLQGPLSVDVLDPDTGVQAPSRTFRKAEIMGELLAERTAEALDAVNDWSSDHEIEALSSGPIEVEVENPFFITLGEVLQVFGRRTVDRAEGITRFIESEVNVLRIGPAQFVLTPNELDPQIGDVYRAAMGAAEHRFIFGLANDEIGYQMPENKFVPGCFECVIFAFGDVNLCPFVTNFYASINPTIGVCDTVFQNNVGARSDPLLQGEALSLLEAVNP